MTEAEWLAFDDPEEMSAFLLSQPDPPSKRKLRLVACACCRLMGHNLVDGRSKEAVAVAERIADGLASQDELERANAAAREATPPQMVRRGWYTEAETRQFRAEDTEHAAASAASCVSEAEIDEFAQHFERVIELTIWQGQTQAFGGDAVGTRKAVAGLLRDIVGNPYRHTCLHPLWRTPAVVAVARAVYAEHCFDDLPILADALEEAGCTDADILTHLRSPGPHVRGCWALDLILGKC